MIPLLVIPNLQIETMRIGHSNFSDAGLGTIGLNL